MCVCVCVSVLGVVEVVIATFHVVALLLSLCRFWWMHWMVCGFAMRAVGARLAVRSSCTVT